ncbi:LLM class flavin-dependent oxidoreductase [Thauera sinica]|uniref:LLM class flavin-dependent oxidoreductase n=1 Tax=Thauera sinica TaxID=2665146 RepID=A0ABW1AMI5_9RHOO|nr:LLM class flavin-dependent oxidoreductase [Thauera sp. K11]ATE62645.1 alkanesulfonate monooxygenase [Thauera sp. K11]
MSLEFIGLVSAQESSESLAPRGPNVDVAFLKASAQSQEYGGFDKVLLAVNTASPDSFVLATYAAAVTDRLGLLIAHRPGFQAPTFAARQFATLDQLSHGRVAINVITGGDGGDLQRDGDFVGHDDRYERTDEYLDVFRKTWTSEKPFGHQGRHYRIEGNLTQVKPVQQPHIPIYFSGASDAAVRVAARHADVYMMWGEPLAQIRERIATVRAAAAAYGRDQQLRFSLSLRPILGATEEEAWARAARILASAKELIGNAATHAKFRGFSANVGSERLVNIAREARVHDKRLWTEIAALTGATGNSTSLVGTPDQVAEAVAEYYDLGVSTFLFRGFDPLRDAVEYGQELLPRIRALVAGREATNRRKAG